MKLAQHFRLSRMGPRESYFGTGAGLQETVTWRVGGEVANEVASGGGDGNGVCYGRVVTLLTP
ncbi:hypothetical protein E2C01_083071 [Portunus trituberculatus]|uniref:Uncharacterized protein n=1 Tax=Portunus trituberculatus TaxID=210409 RepID=A0A5B7J2H2_PORTR|nr:hypothetical protein [Portunus trituberculatus]